MAAVYHLKCDQVAQQMEEIKGKGKEDSSVEDNLDGKRDVA
jgi:hypothetical protein